MFKRRKPRSTLQKARQIVWPSMGWKRLGTYLKHRILRLDDTPHNIALGLALGAGVSFSPLMMTHLIQGGIFAFIFRANIPAALIGTVVGNPWTFPFIWWLSLAVGSAIFTAIGMPIEASPPVDMSLSKLWEMLRHDPMRIALPWLLGGYILCVIVTAGLYPIYLNLIRGAQRARTNVLKHKAAKKITGQDL